jgi:hypothetical protein
MRLCVRCYFWFSVVDICDLLTHLLESPFDGAAHVNTRFYSLCLCHLVLLEAFVYTPLLKSKFF